MKAGLIAVALAGVLLSSVAQATDGNDLLKACQATVRMMDTEHVTQSDNLSIGQCLGMVEGVKSVLFIYEDKIPQNLGVCFPKGGINNGQAARIVSKYLHDNPANLNLDATLLMILAFKTVYPCK